METYKPISTISYNTYDFLKRTLEDLYHERVIQFYAFIHHFPEPVDEYGLPEKKEHFHVYVVPAKKLDTFQLQRRFEEPDLEHPEIALPLGCMDFDHSKFLDWFLYGLHDVDYLASKGLTRQYHYTVEEMHSVSDDALNNAIHKCDFTKYKNFKALKNAVDDNRDFVELVRNGFVPIQQVFAYEHAYNILQDGISRAEVRSQKTFVRLSKSGEVYLDGNLIGMCDFDSTFYFPDVNFLHCFICGNDIWRFNNFGEVEYVGIYNFAG